MNELRTLLRDADPAAHEPPLDAAAVAQMRDRVLRAVQERDAARRHRLLPIYAAATVAGCLALVWLASDVENTRVTRAPAASEASAAVASVRPPRQLHFSTPGGIRVIWVFDPEFEERR